MWAIRNKRTLKWLFGTDYTHYPFRQKTSEDRALILETLEDAEAQMRFRCCGKSYEAVPVRLEVLQ